MNPKTTFLLYKSWGDEISSLSNNEAGILIKLIMATVNHEKDVIPIPPLHICILAGQIMTQIEFEWSKYNPRTRKYHWNYKGGVTPENKIIRNSTEYKFWRFNVFERDNYTCQECGKYGGELNAHHKKHFATHKELRFDLDNGITLCKKCHIDEHKKEVVNG